MTGGRLLVIDDDEAFVEATAIYLGDHGMQVLKTYSGREGVIASSQHVVSLVVVDIHLPDIDGAEVVRQLKQLQPQAPIICISSDDAPDVLRRCEKAGACLFIPKPVDPEDLLDAILRKLHGLERSGLLRGWARLIDLVPRANISR
jgi:CheY-like chemotaxis protein